ncbi:MAG: folate-binding protein YgfZ [Actinobacteria bacterium]|nr:MAG: folate-binding protein YgfZ [Actinomycetota bacterium]
MAAATTAGVPTPVLASEHHALTRGCASLDRSERGKLVLSGAGAVEFLNGQVTNELADLRSGEGRYAAFLTHKGKMLGDVRILAVGADPARAADHARGASSTRGPGGLLLDTERVALQPLFDMIRRFKVGYQVELHKRTLELGLISLLGPRAASLAGATQLARDEHANGSLEVDGVHTLAVRTEHGVDLICDAADTERLHAALRGRGATEVSVAAAECLRVERGRPRYGVDMDDTTIPQEAGLNARAVSFTKGCYVGQETVARLHYKGKPNRHLRGLRLSAPACTGDQLQLAGRPVGRLGSVALSPALGPIALALVRREAEPGAVLDVGEDGVTARVSELPFAGGTPQRR